MIAAYPHAENEALKRLFSDTENSAGATLLRPGVPAVIFGFGLFLVAGLFVRRISRVRVNVND